ncbi:MAG: hypothetical protein L6428_02965 [Candidatus Aminicenantes bacterium]|nr:hypothetical protein [Candidatus Aminicenantes bacterium]
MKGERVKFLALLLLYVLIATFSYQAFSTRDPFFYTPTVDEMTNLWVADQLLHQNLPPQTFWQEPLAFFYYMLLLALGISSPVAIKFVHLFVINPAIILLLYLLARSIKPRLALLAAALYALSPLAMFMSVSLMKTLPAILLVLLMLYGFRLFYVRPEKKRYALFFAVSWFLSWVICQHVLLFLPPLFAAVAHRCEKKNRLGQNNLLAVATLLLAGIVAALSFASVVCRRPLLTLTTNGEMNFILANSQNVRKTMAIWPGPEWQYFSNLLQYQIAPSAESQISTRLPDSVPGWLSLLAKKIFWEFTPHAYFRQSSWENASRVFPPLRIHALFTMVLILLVFAATLGWRSHGILLRSLIACWWLYHAVNIVFIPGIARYNAIILPLTVLLALSGLTVFAFRPRQLILIPCLCLWFSHPPNGFGREYAAFMKLSLDLATGTSVTDISVPEKTIHMADYRQLRAAWLLEHKRHAEAEALLMQTAAWPYYGLEYCQLLAAAQARQRLYFDALGTAVQCVNWPEKDYPGYVKLVIDRMGEMLAAYRSHGRLTPGKLAAVSSLISSLADRYPDRLSLKKAIQVLHDYGGS